MTTDPWAEYLAATQRLDEVRRGAASAAAEQTAAAQAAGEELAGVRARLAPQEARLRQLGVPEDELTPTPGDVAAAAEPMSAGPAAVLAALHKARATADAADAALVPGGRTGAHALRGGRSGWSPALRNLLVYGPFALVVMVVQLALFLSVDETALPVYAPLCGLVMPLAAFGLGWLTIGLVFPPDRGGKVDRTVALGAVVCLAPVLLACVGLGALAVLR
jgi:hypothetical protein